LRAYASHPAVHLYVLGAIASAAAASWTSPSAWPPLRAAAATVAAYPLVWYALHRFVLHSSFLYRWKHTAALWKRIHFDHHQDPYRMDVLFGSPATTLPTIAAVTIPLGFLIGPGPGGAAGALCAGLLITCLYEFCHCVQHLNFKPRHRLLRRMKELHLAHHFHDEVGNYGITSFVVDRMFGTYYPEVRARRRSAHVFNLGYDVPMSERFPWVARLSGGPPRDRPRRPGEGR
jgi:sterol desaturase/sphingolipid hydroxylase (fatty acid hydroxylase superfamily)